MQKVSQGHILSVIFSESIEKEELLLKKYDDYMRDVKDRELSDMISEFIDDSRNHIKLMRDKMIKLSIQG